MAAARPGASGVPRLRWATGHVCAITIHSLWVEPGDRVGVLAALLCRDPDRYEVRFATAELTLGELGRWAPAEQRPSAAALHRMIREAAAPDALPLAPLRNTALWKVLYLCAVRAVRAAVGDFAFYAPVRFAVREDTGLLARVCAADGDGAADPPRPRGAVLRTEARVRLDRDAVRANASPTGDASLARARLCALQAGCLEGAPAVDAEIVTRSARFARRFPDVTQPAAKKVGALTDLFAVREYSVLVGARSLRTRALVPLDFDYLIAERASFSPVALMLLYRQWREALFAGPGQAAPLFAYLGPDVYPHGDEKVYCHMLGFPGFQTLVAPEAGAVAEAVDLYALTDGAWPALGIYAYHALAPAREDADPRAGAEDADRWPAGRVTTILEEPTHLAGRWMAKFDFSSFFATLYACLHPAHARVREVLRARLALGKAHVKRSLLTLVGGLKHLRPRTYAAVIGLANALSVEVERVANAHGFAICTYVKDGFWGVFGALATDRVAPEDAARAAEELRARCEAAALARLADLGAPAPAGVTLRLRLEGVYDRAFAWSPHQYWLHDSATGRTDFLGFPARTAFAREAKEACSRLLRALAEPERDSAGALYEEAERECMALVETGFRERLNPEFWSAPRPIAEWTWLPGCLYDREDALDRDCGPRDAVAVLGHDGERLVVPWALFPAPALLYKIDCAPHVRSALRALAASLSGAAAARFGDAAGEFEFRRTFEFLFQCPRAADEGDGEGDNKDG
ncbi:helicase-primase subunit [Beluga whale alphaherpesvirus 1]|uniref:Helicase-primase subunit n=1 Tax=Beluga whale alphaherpesvirus 1 TaxID=1434720 RepID=A0A286MM73_9ALPH|nr:helicase-primase subunit [Beluga whale alphaherpesvirus 1]ASW27099.1 helicase-primase subunit [Beluga whale alphaherpesvirus 1]